MLEMNLEKALTDQIKPWKSVLVVIDVQNDFCHGKGFFSKKNGEMLHVQRMIQNLVALLKKWREVKMPIIFVRTIHSEWTDSPYGRTTEPALKTVRGGSWRDRPRWSRAGIRRAYRPWQKVHNVGFRVVCDCLTMEKRPKLASRSQ